MKTPSPDMPKHIADAHRKLRSMPAGFALVEVLTATMGVAANLAAFKALLDEESDLFKSIDDIERALLSLTKNQIEPVVEEVLRHPRKTFEEYDA